METNDINMMSEIIIGSILPREIYEKAKKKCEEQQTTINELIKAFIYQFANGEIRIAKRE